MHRPLFVLHPASTRTLRPSRHAGFTLVELLTVMAIIGILMGILIPTVGMLQVQARKAKSTSNLSNVGKAFGLYANEHNGLIPAPTYGQNDVPANTVGSSNPRQNTWLEELAPYLECQYESVPGSLKIALTKADVLTDPQFLAENGAVTDPDKRGYGMNIFLYRADRDSEDNNKPFLTARQSLNSLPNHSRNMIVSTSNDVTTEPDSAGNFQAQGATYPNGDPLRYKAVGLYLFLDGSVQALAPNEARNALRIPETP